MTCQSQTQASGQFPTVAQLLFHLVAHILRKGWPINIEAVTRKGNTRPRLGANLRHILRRHQIAERILTRRKQIGQMIILDLFPFLLTNPPQRLAILDSHLNRIVTILNRATIGPQRHLHELIMAIRAPLQIKTLFRARQPDILQTRCRPSRLHHITLIVIYPDILRLPPRPIHHITSRRSGKHSSRQRSQPHQQKRNRQTRIRHKTRIQTKLPARKTFHDSSFHEIKTVEQAL